jgi:hypothetical protein
MTARRINVRRALWLFAFLCVSVPALGQSDPRIEISPTIGYLWGGALWDRTTEGPDLVVGDHLDYGLRAGWRASPRWVFEFDWTRVPTRLEFSPALPSISLDIDYFTPRVAYNFMTGTIRPYVAGGLGGAVFSLPDSSEGYFTATLAAGVKAFFTQNFGARVEARGLATGVGDPPLGFACTEFVVAPDQSLVPVSCAHDWIINGDVTAGIVFAF